VIEQVYSSAGAWEKGPSYKLGHSKGGGLFFLRDRESHHARRRDHWAPAFSGPAIASYAPMLNKWVDALLDSLVRDEKQNGVVDLSLALQYWTHDLTVRRRNRVSNQTMTSN
jgi:cytochrome P450